MPLRLAEHVHGVTIEDDLVLLDVHSDAYFCLPNAQGVRIARDGFIDHAPKALAVALVDGGMARVAERANAASRPTSVAVTRTARRLIETAEGLDARATPRRWRALLTATRAAVRSRGRPFADLVDGPRGSTQTLAAHMLADIAAYRRLLPWLPIDGACLFRSHMLRTYLRALGHDADWIFGVSVWPFRAHCWLQVGDVALDDEAERLSAYRPILVI